VKSRARVALVALLVLACTPELDWRELKSAEGGFVAMLPGKPQYETRTLGGTPALTMHLWSVRAADSVFGVGYADYPALDEETLDKIRDGLARNLGGRVVEEQRLLAAGLTGREFTAANGSKILRARLLIGGTRLYQLALIGEGNAVPAADADLFLSSFRPLAPRSLQ